jgi:DNA-binding NarL/FixJ family response regulator
MHKEVELYRKAQTLGAFGYILKEHAQDELAACIQTITEGVPYLGEALKKSFGVSPHSDDLDHLSHAEKKVLDLISEQKTSAQIAKMLFISERTVEKHRQNIIKKLDLPKEKNSLLVWALSYKR